MPPIVSAIVWLDDQARRAFEIARANAGRIAAARGARERDSERAR
jgi:hypothetical protein